MVAVDVHQTAREEYVQKEGKIVANHIYPSEAYHERKTGEMGTCFDTAKHGAMTNLVSEEHQ